MDEVAQQRRIQNVCLLVLAGVAVGFVLFWFRSVMVPFVLAVFFAYGLSPVVELQIERLRFPRSLAVLMTLLLGVLLLTVVGALVSTSVRELSANASVYQQQIEQMVEQIVAHPLFEELGIDLGALDVRSLIPTKQLGSVLVGTTNAILDVLSQGMIVLIFLLFLLLGQSARPPRETGVRAEVERKIRRYIVIQGALSGATGLLVGGVLAVLGVPLAMVFGLFAFLLNFIPNVGSIIAVLLPLPVVLVSPEVSGTTAVLAIALPGAFQFVIGSVIAPKVLGDSLDLAPVTILLALMIWGALWGIVGMILAAPMTAVMKMFFERMELTKPVARILAGSPAPPGAA